MKHKQKGFTLIEMLLVVSLIVLLLALLLPALRYAQGEARVAVCASNLRQVYTAISEYQLEHSMRRPWQFANGSGDYPHESGHSAGRPGTPARALMVLTQVLADGKLFFCPDVPIDYETYFNPAPPHDFNSFHGTYAYYYGHVAKWEDPTPHGNGINYINEASRGLIMMDSSHATWSTWGFPYRNEHYNALMNTGNVERITDDADQANYWLWGEQRRPY
jgi:prepilin-type N-terminal cleavage/methylation domain-containing protein